MKKQLLSLIFIFLGLFGHAQKLWWVKTLSNTYYDVDPAQQTVDASGNVYIIKSFNFEVDVDPGPDSFKVVPTGILNTYLVKLGPNGNFLWAKQFSDPTQIHDGNVVPKFITLDAADNIYITGYFEHKIDFDPGPGVSTIDSKGWTNTFVLKLDKDGSFIWVKDFSGGSAYPNSIAVDKSGNIAVCGNFSRPTDFDPGAGNFIMSPYTYYNDDVFIAKLDALGNFLWAKRVGGTSGDFAKAMAFDSTGSVVVTGTFWNTVDFDPGVGVSELTAQSLDAFFLKLDSSGEFVWAKRVGRAQPFSLTIDDSQNLYSTGIFASVADFDPGAGVFSLSSNGDDAFVLKLNSQGDFGWAKKLGGSNSDQGCSIALDNQGNVYTAGLFEETADFDPGPGEFVLTSNGTANPSVFISKLDSFGNFITALAIRLTTSSANTYVQSIKLDKSANIYVTGIYHGPVDFDPGPDSYLLNEPNSAVYTVKLSQAPLCTWTGAVNTAWENAGNWSCGAVPDFKTNVIITAGATVTVNSNVIVNTLSIGTATIFKVNNGYSVTVLH